MRASARRVLALLMRKLAIAGIVAAAAMGLSVQAGADIRVYTITAGTFSEVEHSCTQITALFAQTDCTYGRNRPQPQDPDNPDQVLWMGPLFGGGHYAPGSPGAVLGYIPTTGTEVPPDSLTGVFIPAVPDGKIQAVVTGTLSINDNGTPGNAADDKISSMFSIGPMVRNVATGASTRAVQGWTSMDHQMTEITVSSAVANINGGIDYVIGSRGFPPKRCNKDNPTDCFPTQNASNSFSQGRFWTDIPPNQVGVERSGLMGDPNLGLAPPVQPPPATPTGNVGATSTATFVGLTCSATSVPPVDDCVSSPMVWGGGEPAGFDNIIMQVSTDSSGAITAALAYYSEEYRISFGGAPAGYDNSATMGAIFFTPDTVITAAQDDVVMTKVNTPLQIAVLANDVGFLNPVTVGIVLTPTHGTAVVTGSPGNQAGIAVNYTPSPGFLGVDTFQYAVDDNLSFGVATVTVTVIADADNDRIADGQDNCLVVANPDQRDSNGDGFGNLCDADLDNSGLVNFSDLSLFRLRFGSTDPDANLNGIGLVNFSDLTIFKSLFGKPPGPSGTAP